MKYRAIAWALAAAAALAGVRLANAAEGVPALPAAAEFAGAPCPHCPQEGIVYQDVICHRCKLVPDVKQIKKTVYECKEVPFCLHKLPPLFSHHGHDCCDDCPCPECDCPRYKKVMMKKEIVCKEICGTKCVIEEYVERVPCRVCRPCPYCTEAVPGCAINPPPVAIDPSFATPQATSIPTFGAIPQPPLPPPDESSFPAGRQ
jgi:hypothetical protein